MLYHIHPSTFIGDHLMPLNQIKAINPALYARLTKKYIGRETLMERTIPVLNGKWTDVLFFSPVHPHQIKVQFQQLGLNWKKRLQHWLVLDPKKMPHFSTHAVLYHPVVPKQKGDFSISPNDIHPFDIQQLSASQQSPLETKAHYKESLAEKHPLFIFHRIPHILYHGKIAKTQFTELIINE